MSHSLNNSIFQSHNRIQQTQYAHYVELVTKTQNIMLTRCSALHCIRKDQVTRFKELVVSYIGTDAWSQTFNSMESLVKLILDCTTFGYLFDSDTKLKNIMLQSTELYYKMHVRRVWKMKDYEQQMYKLIYVRM